ncbi:AraC family transcriptional regulator [Flammeovirga sp. SubArs3]|uniref:helix-turn-helix transcriptional regulator n=1 Tax=Flammeovirga sp. SubArs3 TaxID=2995316 RepID=UPI00248AA0D4|nr:AraC family transcriptional regulator [Flammeovirga sp. SubArs3]
MKIDNFKKYKTVLLDLFKGEMLNETIMNVDSEVAKGSIYFLEGFNDSGTAVYVHIDIICEALTFQLSFDENTFFTHHTSLFNEGLEMNFIDNDVKLPIHYHGIVNTTNDITLSVALKKGDVFRPIQLFYDRSGLQWIENNEVRTFLEEKKNYYYFINRTQELSTWIQTVHQVFTYSDYRKELFLRIKTQELFLLFTHYLSEIDIVTTKTDTLSAYHFKVIFDIKTQIEANLGTKPNVKAFVEEYGIHQNLLQEIFQSTFGKTIYNYYTSLRIQKAYEALVTKKYSITEVAFDFGFSSVQHFSKTFSKVYGISPTEVLNNME